MLYDNLGINDDGHLTIGGIDAVDLAHKYGTPLYVLDEDKIRETCRKYTETMKECFGDRAMPLFASKALSFKGIYPVVESEGFGADVVSAGEIYTALAAGFPADKLYFHGDNKTDSELLYALDNRIGCIVVDNLDELDTLNVFACERGVTQKVLLRITVGIDPHTFAAVNTGKVDSQFGLPIETGQAEDFLEVALMKPHLEVMGFHSHIGSQIFESEPFADQLDILLEFANDMRERHGFTAEYFNLGGGFGVKYVESDPDIDIAANIRKISEHLHEGCAKYDFPVPFVLMEPGRSIVGAAGTTLYTVGGVKSITGYQNYISIDGGMTDNPRFALYKSSYTVAIANKMKDSPEFKCTIAGHCCESGDRIQEDVMLPWPKRGDILAVFTTGAYNYSMASNYNRLTKPPIVMLKGGEDRLVVRRETFEDLTACDL